jgi:hypothetical protein
MLLSAIVPAAAEPDPVVLSAEFKPPFDLDWQVLHGKPGPGPACRVRIAEVTDTRADTVSMGTISNRPVRATDAAGWVMSALKSLKRDGRLQLDEQPDASDLVLRAEIIKAYMISLTTDKSTNIVLRVRFTGPNGAAGEQIFRGVETGTDWAATSSETQGQFDRALAKVVDQVDQNLAQRCTAPVATVTP